MITRSHNQRERLNLQAVFNMFKSKVQYVSPVHDDTGGDTGGETPSETPSTNDPTKPTVKTTRPESKAFTQEEVNALIAKERGKDKERNSQLVKQLESLKSTQSMSQEEKQRLEQQIEDLKTQNMTKEELSAREKKKLETALTRERDEAKETATVWRTRFETSLVARELMDAAIEGDAFNPQQLVSMLTPDTKVVEEHGEDGKSTGRFKTEVVFNDADDDGKPVKLVLTPRELVKRLKDIPAKYGNLFKSGAVAGLGSMSVKTVNGQPDYKSMTMEQYKAQRNRK